LGLVAFNANAEIASKGYVDSKFTDVSGDLTELQTTVAGHTTSISNLDENKTDYSDLATVATSGSYNDLSDKPTIDTTLPLENNTSTNAVQAQAIAAAINSVSTTADSALKASDITTGTTNGTIKVKNTDVPVTGLGSAAYSDTSAFATAAQGALADTAVQPDDLGTAAEADVSTTGVVANGTDLVTAGQVYTAIDGALDNVEDALNDYATKANVDTVKTGLVANDTAINNSLGSLAHVDMPAECASADATCVLTYNKTAGYKWENIARASNQTTYPDAGISTTAATVKTAATVSTPADLAVAVTPEP
jgi:ribosome-associated translation inhibitor RaiA